MDGSVHYRKAEELAEKAEQYLGQGDGQESAGVWAAVAQVHATLARAASTEQNPHISQSSVASGNPADPLDTKGPVIFKESARRRK